MSTLVTTIVIAAIVLVLAGGGLAIGLILTGKPKLRGSCGWDPSKKRSESCGKKIKCPLCENEGKKEKDERDT